MTLEKCLSADAWNALQQNKYHEPKVYVYYGFNTYCASVEHVHQIVMAVKEDFPNVTIRDMEVMRISNGQSNRRAGHTMVLFKADTALVKSALKNFSCL